MGTIYGYKLVTDGLILCVDVANAKTYPGSGDTLYDLSKNHEEAVFSSLVVTDNYCVLGDDSTSFSSASTITFPQIPNSNWTLIYGVQPTGSPSQFQEEFINLKDTLIGNFFLPSSARWLGVPFFYSTIRSTTPLLNTWTETGDLLDADNVRALCEDSTGNLYAGTDPDGEVFKSTDEGDTWTNTGDLTGATYVNSLLVDSLGNLYAGTYPNGNVFKSTDLGDNWTNTGELTGAVYIYSLIEDSNGNLFAGTSPNGNVFKSTNSGDTWTETGDLSGAIQALSLCEDSTGNLYAATGINGDVFRSEDSGDTWTNTGNLSGATHVYSVLADSSGNLFAGTSPDGKVFKSTNFGTTWTETGDLLDATHVTSLIEGVDGKLFAGTYPNGNVFKSTDLGDNWTNTGELTGATHVMSLIKSSTEDLYAGTFPNGNVFKSAEDSYDYWGRTILTPTEFATHHWHIFSTVFNKPEIKNYKDDTLLATDTVTVDLVGYGDLNRLKLNSNYGNKINLGFVILYNRTLTDSEIQQNFNALRGHFSI